jgi:hypothetical protein
VSDAADAGTDVAAIDATDAVVEMPDPCATFPNLGTAFTETHSSAAYADTAAGGTFVPGTYVATARTVFGTATAHTWRQTLYLRTDGTVYDVQDVNTEWTGGGGLYMVTGMTLNVSVACPAAPDVPYKFTASGDTLTLFDDDHHWITTYMKQ